MEGAQSALNIMNTPVTDNCSRGEFREIRLWGQPLRLIDNIGLPDYSLESEYGRSASAVPLDLLGTESMLKSSFAPFTRSSCKI